MFLSNTNILCTSVLFQVTISIQYILFFTNRDSSRYASGLMEVRLTDRMKRSFFQATAVSILLYGCTTWTLTKKLENNYTKMLRAILNQSRRHHSTKQQLYSHLHPIMKTFKFRRNRYAGHCWRSRDELIRDVLIWTPSHGRRKARQPAQTYIQKLCEDTGCSPEDLPEAMNDRDEWPERVRDIRAGGTRRW